MDLKDLNPKDYTKYTFGKFLKARAEELGMSDAEISLRTGISLPQLKQVYSGKMYIERTETLVNLVLILKISEVDKFFDLAFVAHYGVTKTVIQYLAENDAARNFVQLAMEEGWTAEDWIRISE